MSLVMAWDTFPYSYTSPYIHSWIFKTLSVIIFWVRVTHKKLNVNSSTWPTPTWHTPPTPTWPTPPHPYMTHPTPPHLYMTHPTPPLHDPPHPPLHDPPHPTPPHPYMTYPTPPLHDPPTPGTFLGTKEPFFMGCFTMSPFR